MNRQQTHSTDANHMVGRPVSDLHRLLALALTLAVVLGLYGLLVRPWLTAYRDNSARLEQLGARWQRLANRTATAAEIEAQIQGLAGDRRLDGLLLDETTDAFAAAALQRTVKTLATASGAQLLSSANLPQRQDGHLPRIGIAVSLRTDTRSLIDLLRRLEQHRPWLFIDNLYVAHRSVATLRTSSGKNTRLDTRFDLYSYSKAGLP